MIWFLVSNSISSLITYPLVRLKAALFLSLFLTSAPLHMQCPQDEMLPPCLGLRPQLRHFLPQEAFLDIPLFSGWIFSGSRMTLLLPLPLTWPRRIHIGVAKCWTESEGPQGAASVSAAKEAVGPQGLLFLLGASLALYIE